MSGGLWQGGKYVLQSTIENKIATLEAEVAKLQAFKDYTHKRMDELGVPHEVPSPHTDAGCRIGGRFDWLSDHLE